MHVFLLERHSTIVLGNTSEDIEYRHWVPFLVAVTVAEALNVATPPLKVEQPFGRQRARAGGDLGSGLGEQVKVWVGWGGKDWGKWKVSARVSAAFKLSSCRKNCS